MKKTKKPSTPRKSGPPEGTPAGQVVLLSVTGQSPAVLTETVWALAKETPAIIPHRVVVLTTTVGRDILVKELLSPPENCVWDQLRSRLEGLGHDLTDRLHFGQTPHDIRVFTIFDPKLRRTRELADIGSEEENMAAADFITETVRGLAMDDEVRLVASVAGGRKTMSALLFAVMSLLAKEDDLLTHVLINDPFDSRGLKPRFYFPPAAPVVHRGTDREGAPVSASSQTANIQLGKIPFVALRNLFERDLKKKWSYSRLVRECQNEAREHARQNVRLAISRSKLGIKVNGMAIPTSIKQHAYLLFLAERAAAEAPAMPNYAAAFADFNQFCKRLYGEQNPSDFTDWRGASELKDMSLDFNQMERFCIKMKNELKEKLEDVGPNVIGLTGLLPQAKRFSLDLPPSRVTITG